MKRRIERSRIPFLGNLLVLDPAERATAENALKDPWLQSQVIGVFRSIELNTLVEIHSTLTGLEEHVVT